MMGDGRIPEGRKPLTDADLAALTRRLAGTAVDYKELYEAAKRDAEEAEAYAAELEANGLANRVAIMRLEAKLAKAVDVIEWALICWDDHNKHGYNMEGDWVFDARTTLAELTGGKDG